MLEIKSFIDNFEYVLVEIAGKRIRIVSEMLSCYINAELPLLVDDIPELLSHDKAKEILDKATDSHAAEIELLCSVDIHKEQKAE